MQTSYFLAGGTSELGELVATGLVCQFGRESLTCLVRKTSDIQRLERLGVKLVTGDVSLPDSYREILGPSVVYLDMTNPKYYDQTVQTLVEMGTSRAFFVTTTGVFSRYQEAAALYKFVESRIRTCGIAYTMLRPSMIYGSNRDRNMSKLLRFLSKWPIFPIFGNGKALMQPVYIQDLADGILSAVVRSETTKNKEYNLCGPNPLMYEQILIEACKALGKQPLFLHIPHWLAVAAASIGEKIPGFPVKKEQVLRLLEDKLFDIGDAQRDLAYQPRPFSEGIRDEVDLLCSQGILRKG